MGSDKWSYLNCHWDVLFLGVVVVLIHIQHNHSIGQSESCIYIVEWFSIAFLEQKGKLYL